MDNIGAHNMQNLFNLIELLDTPAWGKKCLEFPIQAAQECLALINGNNLHAIAAGGTLVPQLGNQAGQAINFSINFDCQNATENSNNQWATVNSKVWDAALGNVNIVLEKGLIPTTHSLLTVKGTDTKGAVILILWCVTTSGSTPVVEKMLALLCKAIQHQQETAKLAQVMKRLSEAPWFTQESIETKTFSEEALECKLALQCADVLIWKVAKENLKLVGSTCIDDVSFDMPLGKGIAGTCATDSKNIQISDLSSTTEIAFFLPSGMMHAQEVRARGWKSGLFIPIDLGGEIGGVIGIYMLRPYAITSFDIWIATLYARRLGLHIYYEKQSIYQHELQERYSRAGVLVSGASLIIERIHDARNRLNVANDLLGYIGSTEGHSGLSDAKAYAAKAALEISAAQTLHKKLQQLMGAGKAEDQSRKLISPFLIAQDAIEALGESIDKGKVHVENKIPHDILIKANPAAIERVFVNLLINSIHELSSYSRKGKREIKLFFADFSADEFAIKVHDNGPGIEASQLAKVFDYFETTKVDGMGFGLPIAKRLMAQNGGKIMVESKFGISTEFSLIFPKTE